MRELAAGLWHWQAPRFEINRWLRGCVTRDQVVARLRPLLERPVELVLPTHGAPTDRAALERALS